MNYNWYSRYRKYKYGDYKVIDGKGYYYNEDSGKWVNRLNKKVIEEKYIRYEFSIYDDRDIEKEFGWSFIDRVGKFIFLLYKSGLENERIRGSKYVFVDSRDVVYGILGSGYREIIKRLDEELNIIDLKFGKGKFGKVKVEYKLNDLFFSSNCYRRVVYIRNSRLTRFLDRYYAREFEGNKYIKYEIDCCKRLSLEYNDSGINMLLEKRLNRILQQEYYEKDWDFLSLKERSKKSAGWSNERKQEYIRVGRSSFELLKLDIDNCKNGGFTFRGFSVDNKFSGRINNIVNSKMKEFRSLLKLDEQNLIEYDMVNGYVSLLYRVFKGVRDLKKGESLFNDKIVECLGDLNGNDFLNKYSMCFEGNLEERIDFYKKVGLDLGDIEYIVGDDKRAYIKGLILYLINGEVSDGKRKNYLDGRFSYNEIMEFIFGSDCFKAINKIKSSVLDFKFGDTFYGYETFKNMSKILMYMEVVIMKGIWDELIKRNIAYISLYDGMLIKKSERHLINTIAENRLVGIDSCIRMSYKL